MVKFVFYKQESIRPRFFLKGNIKHNKDPKLDFKHDTFSRAAKDQAGGYSRAHIESEWNYLFCLDGRVAPFLVKVEIIFDVESRKIIF